MFECHLHPQGFLAPQRKVFIDNELLTNLQSHLQCLYVTSNLKTACHSVGKVSWTTNSCWQTMNVWMSPSTSSPRQVFVDNELLTNRQCNLQCLNVTFKLKTTQLFKGMFSLTMMACWLTFNSWMSPSSSRLPSTKKASFIWQWRVID